MRTLSEHQIPACRSRLLSPARQKPIVRGHDAPGLGPSAASSLGTDDGFAPGDAVTLDTAWWIRLSPRQFTPGLDEIEWRGVLEVLGRWQADDEVGGLDANNGGTEWTFVAGLQTNVQNLSFEVGGLIPLDDSTTPTG